MGSNLVKSVKCEADPAIVIPAPPPPPGSGGSTEPMLPPINEKFRNNPGTWEELHKRCKDVFPQPFEGAKLVFNKGLSQAFQVTHSLAMSSIQPSGYRLGATYVGENMISPSEPAVVLLGDMDPSGNLNAHGIQSITDALKVKFSTQVQQSKYAGFETSLDYRGSNWTVSSALVNPNVFSESGIGVASFLYAINPKICVGAQAMHQKSAQLPEGAATLGAVCARYSGDTNVWSAAVGNASVGLCYYRRMSEELQLGVEFENNFLQSQMIGSIGYQYDIPKANFTMKGMVDSNWTVTGVLEKRMLPMPCSFTLSASVNHTKNQFRLGCGMTIGG